MTLAGSGETAIYLRMADHAPLTALLEGGPSGIYLGWATRRLDPPYSAGDFPIITYRLTSATDLIPSLGEFWISLDEWAWPSGASGGWARLDAIDAELEYLFVTQQWRYMGRTVAVLQSQSEGWDTAPNTPLRRTRRLRCGF